MNDKIFEKNKAYQDKVEALLLQLEHFSEAQLNRKPKPEAWSAIQTIHHLILVEELGLRYVQKKLSFSTPKEKAGIKHRFRAQLLKTYFSLPLKFKAPAVVGSDLPDHANLEDTKIKWLAIRQKWTEFFESMPESLVEVPIFKHPIAGRMTWLGMLEFHIDHMNHHFKQIITAASGPIY